MVQRFSRVRAAVVITYYTQTNTVRPIAVYPTSSPRPRPSTSNWPSTNGRKTKQRARECPRINAAHVCVEREYFDGVIIL